MKTETVITVALGALGICGVSNASVIVTPTKAGEAIRAEQKVQIDKIGQLADLVNQHDVVMQVLAVEGSMATVQFTSANSLMDALATATVSIEKRPDGTLIGLQEAGRCPPGDN